jgi:hypothetical protein
MSDLSGARYHLKVINSSISNLSLHLFFQAPVMGKGSNESRSASKKYQTVRRVGNSGETKAIKAEKERLRERQAQRNLRKWEAKYNDLPLHMILILIVIALITFCLTFISPK